MMISDRRRYRRLVVRRFQIRLILGLALYMCLAGIVLVATLFGPAALQLLDSTTSAAERSDAATAFLALHSRAWIGLGLTFVAALVRIAVMSHRVAGPLVRMSEVFRAVGRGDVSMRFRLRKKDYLQAEARALDQMLRSLRRRLRAASGRADRLERTLCDLRPQTGASTESAWHHATRDATRLRRTLSPYVGEPDTASVQPAAPANRSDGFTLIEILIVAALVGTLAALAIPAYERALDAARVARAISEIRAIDTEIRRYDLANGQLPDTLAQLGLATTTTDPWGRPYQYLRILGAPGGGGGGGGGGRGGGGGGGGGVGQARKDKNLVPINHDFDLYSPGPDGLSVAPLTGAQSRDDIVRASDGGFFGVARDF